ncbi:hypothetical protein HK405_007441, partial [Cladochytrium tenue]
MSSGRRMTPTPSSPPRSAFAAVRGAAAFLALASAIFAAFVGIAALRPTAHAAAARLAATVGPPADAFFAALPAAVDLDRRDLLLLAFVTALAIYLPLASAQSDLDKLGRVLIGTSSPSHPLPPPPPQHSAGATEPASKAADAAAAAADGAAATAAAKPTASAARRPNPHLALLPSLQAKFLEYVDTTGHPAVDPSAAAAAAATAKTSTSGAPATWVRVLSRSYGGGCEVEVHRRAGSAFCFRLVATLQGSAEEAFDLLSDVEARGRWDDLCEDSGVADDFGDGCRVIYMITRGFMLTAPREALVA